MFNPLNKKFRIPAASCAIVAVTGMVAFHSVGAPSNNTFKRYFFNDPGNVLIADQFNNRVIETDPNGNILWQYGNGPSDVSGKSPIGVNDAERVGILTLVSGTGTPAGVSTEIPNGAADNRVMLINQKGQIVWQYGQFGASGTGFSLLNTPVQATYLPNNDVLITDQGNNRIIEVNLSRRIVWQYPGNNSNPDAQLNSPNSAELLANGHILISDENNNRVIEVGRNDKIVATYTAGGTLGAVAFASRLKNGHTLITDAGNAAIVEIDAHDNVVWDYEVDTDSESLMGSAPSRAVRLANGDTLISDQFNNQVIRVNSHSEIVMTYGLPLDDGNNIGYDLHTTQNGLYAPYDAKIIGDYTGLTPPLPTIGFH